MARIQPVLKPADLAVLEGEGNRLSPKELGVLAKQLAAASSPAKAARIRERLTRGFYASVTMSRLPFPA